MAKNFRRIDLYGKVVDQNGQPIAGVQVKGSIVLAVSLVSSENKDVVTVTDASGRFQFVDLHGIGFGVMLQKSGYEFNGKPNWSADSEGAPERPVVSTMWKLQGAEPMVHSKIHDYIPCDGTEIHYDLSTGKKVSTGGGLVVKFTRDPVDIQRGKPFEWTLTLEVAGGGLVEMHDPYPYEAPADGYEETVTITTGPEPKTYTDSTNKNYYYKSADGKYGRLNIELQADFQPPPTSFDASIYFNPSGSRNLEYDPAKQIKP